MSLPTALSVSIETSRRFMRITSQVRDLRYRSVVPGGFANATISLHRPLAWQPDEVAYYGRIYIHDARTGRVVWEGRLEDPGRSAGVDGEVWELAAVGPMAHVHDHRQVYIMVDRNLQNWERSTTWSDSSSRTTVTDTDDGDTPALLLEAPEGSTVPTDWRADMIYRHVRAAGQTLARLACTVDNGGSSSTWDNELVTRVSSGTIVDSANWSTTPANLAAALGAATAIPSGHDLAHVRIHRTGSSFTATANSWGLFYDVIVLAVRQDAEGNDITTGYSGDTTVLASEVVTDLLGRMLDQYDGANATVATTGYGIEQLAYPDSVSAGDVLDDLMDFEPGYYWAAWESGETGLFRFEWAQWTGAGSIRYEARVIDGMKSTGSADGLYNAVKVRYVNARNAIQVIERTQSVPELDDAGITRTAFIDLGDEIGTRLAQAQRVGDEFLADHLYPPNQGTLTIARPILDRISGLMVQPWELRPGTVLRVSGIQPNVDSLNRTDRNGVSIFRVVSTEFDSRDGVATLELDSVAPSIAQKVARLERARRRRLRRR